MNDEPSTSEHWDCGPPCRRMMGDMKHHVPRLLDERVDFDSPLFCLAFVKSHMGDRRRRINPRQLTTNTKVFFANRGNFQYDAARRQFQLSSILKWFGDDFGNGQAAQLRAIAPYLPTREAYDAAVANSVSVSYLDYDWGLNDQTAARAARR